jgi:excisionase family DNA binding protein
VRGNLRRLYELAGLKFPAGATVAIYADDGGIRWTATRRLVVRRPMGLPCPWRGLVDRTPPAGEVSMVRKRSSREYVDRPLRNIRAAASHLGCSERFIRRLVQERRIPFVKLAGTRVRFLKLDLDQWVAGQRVEARR